MTVNIWSETLTQVLKCSDCGKKFTYDPVKEAEREQADQKRESAKKQGGISVSGIINKGLKEAMNVASASVKIAKKEVDKITDTVNSLGSEPTPSAPPSAAKDQDTPRETSRFSEEGPAHRKKIMASKNVACPFCSKDFQAGLPDNDKDILTTKCPDCGKIFTFLRESPAERKQRELEEKRSRLREETGDEDFAIPIQIKESMQREETPGGGQVEGEGRGEWTGTMDGTEEQEGTEERQWDSLELIPESGSRRQQMGRMLGIVCPYCNESFQTPAPRKKRKVNCPICEEDFEINSHGEYVAKKALGGFSEALAKIVGIDTIRSYKDAMRESLEGFEILKDTRYLRHRMKNRSGMAGLLLIAVALIGILYAGALMITIPGMGEDEADGNVSVTGNVLFEMDTIEGANVNITELGMSNRTNSAGRFAFNDVPAGDHTLEITAPGKGILVVKFTIGTKEAKQGNKDLPGLVLPANGTVTEDLREDRAEGAGLVTGLFAAFVFVVSLLALIGGLLALQARRFHASLFIAVISVASIGFFIGIVLAILAILLLIIGRKEFVS